VKSGETDPYLTFRNEGRKNKKEPERNLPFLIKDPENLFV
jgi:hypothetical protein